MKQATTWFVASLVTILTCVLLIMPVYAADNENLPAYDGIEQKNMLENFTRSNIPNPITEALVALGITIENFDSNFSCASALVGVFDRFDTCTMQPNSSTEGCAREAARFIESPLCESVCSSNCM